VVGAFKHDGVCACQPDVPTACGQSCTDITLDDDNCGACGHACAPTSACNAGRCGPSVTTVISPAPGCGAITLVIAGETLYWTDRGHGTVESQPIGGGPRTTISSTEPSPGILAVGATTLFWVDVVSQVQMTNSYGIEATLTTATARAVTLPKGTPVDLATESNFNGGIRGLVASEDGATLYYSADTKVRAVPAAGGVAIDVGSENRGGIPTGLGRDGNTIGYITDFNGNVDVITVQDGVVAQCGAPDPSDPTGERLLMVNCVRIGGCTPDALFDTFIVRGPLTYWADDGSVDVGGPLSGPNQEKQQVAFGAIDNITGLAGAPDFLYFSESSGLAGDASGIVERTAYAPQSMSYILARAQQTPRSLAVDATKVYWSTDDCAINSVPR
jgi:stigma-specific protein Stig1